MLCTANRARPRKHNTRCRSSRSSKVRSGRRVLNSDPAPAHRRWHGLLLQSENLPVHRRGHIGAKCLGKIATKAAESKRAARKQETVSEFSDGISLTTHVVQLIHSVPIARCGPK